MLIDGIYGVAVSDIVCADWSNRPNTHYIRMMTL